MRSRFNPSKLVCSSNNVKDSMRAHRNALLHNHNEHFAKSETFEITLNSLDELTADLEKNLTHVKLFDNWVKMAKPISFYIGCSFTHFKGIKLSY